MTLRLVHYYMAYKIHSNNVATGYKKYFIIMIATTDSEHIPLIIKVIVTMLEISD